MKAKSQLIKEQQLATKLAHIKSTGELKKIYGSVSQQNETLRSDIMSLKYKVQLLMEKQKVKQVQHTEADEGKNRQLSLHQKELKQQYRIMQQLKKRKQQSQLTKATDELNDQYQKIVNQLTNVDQELVEAKIKANDLKNETARLQKTIATNGEIMKRNDPKINQFSQQNGELRKKIFSLKKISSQKQYQSAKVMNSMYTIKTRYSKNQEVFSQIQKKKLSTIKLTESTQKIDLQSLQKEVVTLKKEVQKAEQDQTKNQLQMIKKRDEIVNTNKQDVKKFKQLQQKRSRLVGELNKYKKIWQRYIEIKNNNKLLKQYIQNASQAQQYITEQPFLRRDFAGITGGKIKFDDRQALKQNKKSFIVGFYVYEMQHTAASKHLLIALRAIYDDNEANFSNIVPLPGQYLSKCKMTKYQFVEGDFIKLFKVKYNAVDNRILKLQIRTNKNNRYEFGDKRPFNDLISGQNVYGFDISIQQYPVCLFGSFNYSRSQWYMESFGVQINDLP